MLKSLRAVAMLVGPLAFLPGSLQAAGPKVWFDTAVQYDLGGGEEAAQRAFALYLRAAEAGLPEAEFNVAVMLDSGRGITPDVGQAATWYARAATHGNRRAAYNLGQLYEAGQGVSKNEDLAREWFIVSDLPAARDRLTSAIAHPDRSAKASPPVLIAPAAEDFISPDMGGVELVWTSEPQPEPVHFFVELRSILAADSQEVFSSFSDTSSILATLPDMHGDYAWRVFTVARDTSRYMVSGWKRFSVAQAGWTATSEAVRP